MKIPAQLVHDMPGRVRIRLPAHRGDADLFARLEDALLESRLFQNVRVNPATASLVLEFDGPRDRMLAALRKRLPFDIELSPVALAALPASAGAGQAEPLRLVSGRDLNRMFLAGTVFSVVGLVQTLRGQIMIPAMGAFWCASTAFRLARMQPDSAAAALEAGAASE